MANKSNMLNTVTLDETRKAVEALNVAAGQRDNASVYFATLLILGSHPDNEAFIITPELHAEIGGKTAIKYPVNGNAAALFIKGDRVAFFSLLFGKTEAGLAKLEERKSTITEAGRIARSMQRAMEAGLAKIEGDKHLFMVQWAAFVPVKQRTAVNENQQKDANSFVLLSDRKSRSRSWKYHNEKGEERDAKAVNTLASLKRAWGEARQAGEQKTAAIALNPALEFLSNVIDKTNSDETAPAIKVNPDNADDRWFSLLTSIAMNDTLYAMVIKARKQHDAVTQANKVSTVNKRAAANGKQAAA